MNFNVFTPSKRPGPPLQYCQELKKGVLDQERLPSPDEGFSRFCSFQSFARKLNFDSSEQEQEPGQVQVIPLDETWLPNSQPFCLPPDWEEEVSFEKLSFGFPPRKEEILQRFQPYFPGNTFAHSNPNMMKGESPPLIPSHGKAINQGTVLDPLQPQKSVTSLIPSVDGPQVCSSS